MDQNENLEMENGRRAMYGFFSTLFKRPLTSEELGRILDDETLRTLESLFRRCESDKFFHGIKKDLEDTLTIPEKILLDYESLFRVPGEHFVYPYESAYRDSLAEDKTGRRPVMDFSHANKVSAIYNKEGLDVADGFDESADHLATELEYMSYLCRKRAENLGAGNRDSAKLYEKKQAQFLKEHLACWAESCLKKIEQNASTPFYRVFAGFLQEFLREETEGNEIGIISLFRRGGETEAI